MNIFSFLPEAWRPNRKVVVGFVVGAVLTGIATFTGVSPASLAGVEGMEAAVTLVIAYLVSYWVPEPA
jgi:hypothetical protein